MSYQTEPGLGKKNKKNHTHTKNPTPQKKNIPPKNTPKNTTHLDIAAMKREPLSNSCFLIPTVPKFLLKQLSFQLPQS